ncbi:MAG TPA: c-type cytochrome [Allosphingosinicella sp.]
MLVAILAGCDRPETPPHLRIAGADAERGHEAILRYGCGACHRVPGIPGAKGLVGPPLDHFGERALLAGQLPNRPATLIAWLVDPPALIPGTGMPDMGVTPRDARDIAAYLYSLQADEAMIWPPEVPPDRERYDDPDRPD